MSAATGYVYQNVGLATVNLSGWHIGVIALAPKGYSEVDEAATYVEQNVGFFLPQDDAAIGHVEQNIGFALQPEDVALGYVYQNVVE